MQGQIDVRADRISARLRGLRVVASRRNGHTALDLYDRDGLVETLVIGTKREVFAYLGAMAATLDITNR